MKPDLYLQLAATVAVFFVKIAAAYLLCLMLTRLLGNARHRFAIWIGFMLGSLAYWLYLGTLLFPADVHSWTGHAAAQQFPLVAHQFLLPASFQRPAIIVGGTLVGIYGFGVLFLLLLALRKRVKLRDLLKQAVEPSSEVTLLFREVRGNLGGRRCDLLIAAGISSPATVYSWHPQIILPPFCEQLGAGAEMEDILWHELTHVVRRDYFWSNLSGLICVVLFFHPAVWQARRQMRIQREIACDLAVVAARPEHRADYAFTLTRVARLCLPRNYPMIGIDFAASPTLLADRINAILNHPPKASWLGGIYRLVTSLFLVGVYGFLCSAFAVALAFSYAGQSPQNVLQVQPAQKVTHPARYLRPRKNPTSRPVESSIIESPAYRLQTSPDTRANTLGGSVTSPINTTSDGDATMSARSVGPAWPPASTSKKTTLGSIIAATVGAIGGQGSGSDKDDRGGKRRDHFQFSSATSNLY